MKDKRHIIAMSGAGGFVGTNLDKTFLKAGWEVIPLTRNDFASGQLAEKINGADVVVNLAGAPIIHRWTAEYKKEMYDSRINVTKSLVEAISEMEQKPKLLISTSAVGFYASGGPHTESNHVKADNFLGHLTEDWENEALKAVDLGIRTVIFRFGIVLGKEGGALKQMLAPFKMGMGGKIGDGSQPFSWIHIKDLESAFKTVIENSTLSGAYNLTAPNPTTNEGLTKALGRALHKPALIPVPKFALRMKFGEGADILTDGQTVFPERLIESGFNFSFPEIDDALNDCIYNDK